jgi:hypothetical protein
MKFSPTYTDGDGRNSVSPLSGEGGGFKGNTGHLGPRGDQGDKGERGNSGPKGSKGEMVGFNCLRKQRRICSEQTFECD